MSELLAASAGLPPGFEWSDADERPVYTLYTAREVADALGVVERTVRRWIEAGRLPAVKENGVFRIRMEDARSTFESSRAAVAVDRSSLAARIEWLEAENERLWALLELALGREQS